MILKDLKFEVFSVYMKQYQINKLSLSYKSLFSKDIADFDFGNASDAYPIDKVNWIGYPSDIKVKVQIVLLSDAFLLKFNVENENIRAKLLEDNAAVYQDSCVEFFIDPFNDGSYYNFEFNCLVTLLLAHGSNRENRVFADEDILKQIVRQSSFIENNMKKAAIPDSKIPQSWILTVVIPFTALFKHPGKTLDKSFRANFYKCGDLCKPAHYLSWQPIHTEKPDFHRPEYFADFEINSKVY